MPLFFIKCQALARASYSTTQYGKPLGEMHSLLFELTAGCVDIVTARVANGGFNAMHGEPSLERLDFVDRRRLEKRAGSIVKLDEVDVAKCARAEVDKGIHLGGRVIDAIDHGELVARTTAGLFHVGLQGLMETLKGVLFNTRHKFVAR